MLLVLLLLLLLHLPRFFNEPPLLLTHPLHSLQAMEEARAKGEHVDEEAQFDSNCITPGTEFMARVSMHFEYFIRDKLKNDPKWHGLTVFYSGHDVPGEGEHKVRLARPSAAPPAARV